MTDIDVSIVLPVYNEASHLEEEVRRIEKAMDASSFTYEIIVVDDGSTDGSGDLAETLGVRTIRLNTNILRFRHGREVPVTANCEDSRRARRLRPTAESGTRRSQDFGTCR